MTRAEIYRLYFEILCGKLGHDLGPRLRLRQRSPLSLGDRRQRRCLRCGHWELVFPVHPLGIESRVVIHPAAIKGIGRADFGERTRQAKDERWRR